MNYILVFINGFIFDLLYAIYTKYINVDKYGLAGLASVLIMLSGTVVGILVYIEKQYENLIPYGMGLWAGTYSMKYLKKYLIK
jgi:hypothetical protein